MNSLCVQSRVSTRPLRKHNRRQTTKESKQGNIEQKDSNRDLIKSENRGKREERRRKGGREIVTVKKIEERHTM